MAVLRQSRVSAFVIGTLTGSTLVYILLCKLPPQFVENRPHATDGILKFGTPGPIVDFLSKEAYASAYNRATRNAFWSAEHITKDSLYSINNESGHPNRTLSHFSEDKHIPIKYRSRLKDYVGTGFDRGHLVPARDVQMSQNALDETFILTNVSPQDAGLNRGYWSYFESFVRSLTKHFEDVYVVTGPAFLPKEDEGGKFWVKYQVLGNPPNTAVPTHFFKIIVVSRSEGKYETQGFLIPNQQIENQPLTNFIVPIDSIEHATGLSFFPNLDLQDKQTMCSTIKCEIIPFKNAFKQIHQKKD